jgi:hypothetical protein
MKDVVVHGGFIGNINTKRVFVDNNSLITFHDTLQDNACFVMRLESPHKLMYWECAFDIQMYMLERKFLPENLGRDKV